MNKFSIAVPLIISSALLSNTVLANSPSWDQITVGYRSMDANYSGSDESTGFIIAGKYLISESFFIGGSYASVESLDTMLVDLGYRYAFTDYTDFYAFASLSKIEDKYTQDNYHSDGTSISWSDDASGWGLGLGVRSMLTDNFEMYASTNIQINEIDLELGLSGGFAFYLSEQLSLGASYSSGVFDSVLGVNLNYDF